MKDFSIIKSVHEGHIRPTHPEEDLEHLARGWYLRDTVNMVVKHPPKYSWRWFKMKVRNYFSKEKEEKC